ncbi:MAG: M15 family metallopeptidase [Myxococcales bacterium]|nr:M15 family metallopeptidase [Myxococcales bacterium]
MLWRPAAVRFRAMKAAMEEAGVWSGINESYRTYDKQVYFKNCQISRACNNGNTAATPGTSNHGWGMAVDLVIGPGTYQWLSAHATEYGFDNAEGARAGENWHWTYTGADQR